MKEDLFRVTVKPFAQGTVWELNGDLTKQAETALLTLNSEHKEEAEAGKALVLNFTAVLYINSAGIAVLIRLARSSQKNKRPMFAYGLTPHYQKLFRMVGLTDYMAIYPDQSTIVYRLESLEAADS